MLEFLTKFMGWLKGQPVTLRLIIITLLGALLAALSFTSCARSSMRFKGTGEVEYLYKGSLGPSFTNSKSE